MKNRNPIAVALLPFVTFGIYGIYWEVKTKEEMKALGADIPTAWLIIVPIVNYYWLWKYSQGVEKVTNGKLQGILAFLLLAVLGSIGSAVIQDSFNNNVANVAINSGAPVAPTPPIIDSTTITPASAPTPPTNPIPPTTVS